MFVMRPVTANDLQHLLDIAMSATLGITSLPKNEEKLKAKLKHAVESFNATVTSPKNELYLFLLEDTTTGQIGGIAGILSKSGMDEPSYFLRSEMIRPAQEPYLPELRALRPVSYVSGPSEICSLFLKREFRQGGYGKLLSFSRFLFMASHPERFDTTTIAEMRGVITKSRTSPIWNSLGHHFFNTSFDEAMKLRDQGLFHVADVIPQYPIYLSLLTKAAKRTVGKVHPNTKPALQMLKEQGFKLTNDIDLFDGGPKIEAVTKEIKVIKDSIQTTIGHIEDEITDGFPVLISNCKLQFRSCETTIKKLKNGTVSISKETAEALQIGAGSSVRYYKAGKA